MRTSRGKVAWRMRGGGVNVGLVGKEVAGGGCGWKMLLTDQETIPANPPASISSPQLS